jgi:hypothetical protein
MIVLGEYLTFSWMILAYPFFPLSLERQLNIIYSFSFWDNFLFFNILIKELEVRIIYGIF